MKARAGVYCVIAFLLFSLGFYIAWTIQGHKVQSITTKYNNFVANAKLLGEAAIKEAQAKTEAYAFNKKESDDEYKTSLASLAADNKRLRNNRARGSFVPPATAGTRNTETACFDRDKLESAIRVLDTEVSGIVERGDQERVGLDSAKRWANSTK